MNGDRFELVNERISEWGTKSRNFFIHELCELARITEENCPGNISLSGRWGSTFVCPSTLGTSRNSRSHHRSARQTLGLSVISGGLAYNTRFAFLATEARALLDGNRLATRSPEQQPGSAHPEVGSLDAKFSPNHLGFTGRAFHTSLFQLRDVKSNH